MIVKISKISLIIISITLMMISLTSTTLNYRDFVKLFYLSGKLVNSGQVNVLYSNIDINHGYFGSFCDFQRSYFENYRKIPIEKMNCPFFYMPLIAYLLSPFANLNYRLSFIIWMIINIAILFAALYIIKKFNSNKTKFKFLDYTFDVFLFIPVLYSLYVGQTSIIFGIFPLIIGLNFWLANKPYKASIFWSLAVFKFQFLFMPLFSLFINILCNFEKKKSFQSIVLISFFTLIILSLNLLFGGLNNFLTWTYSLKYVSLMDLAIYMKNFKETFFFLSFCLTLESHLNPIAINCIIFILFTAILITLVKTFSQLDLSNQTNKILLFLSSSLTFFVISTHSLYYDLALILFCYIFFDNHLNQYPTQNKHLINIKNALKILLVLVNIYGYLAIFYTNSIHPTILMVPYLMIFAYVLIEIYKYSRASSQISLITP